MKNIDEHPEEVEKEEKMIEEVSIRADQRRRMVKEFQELLKKSKSQKMMFNSFSNSYAHKDLPYC